MKTHKIIFWITTAIVSLMMLYSAYQYLTTEEMKAAFTHLGFPDYFRIELAVAKLFGALILLIPAVPKSLKEFTYAGFAIVFVSAFIAHMSNRDPMSYAMAPVIFLILLIVSYIYYSKLKKA